MGANKKTKLSVPTPPITKALVAGTAGLRKVLEAAATEHPHLAQALRDHGPALEEIQRAAELSQQMIEKRLRAVEDVAEDVLSGTGAAFPLSSTVPKPVGSAGVIGTEKAASHGDHVHAGVASIAKDGGPAQGAVTFAGSGVSQSGSVFTFNARPRDTILLPLAGPHATMRGTTFLATSKKVRIPGGYTQALHLIFPWAASGTGTASWRLIDLTANLVILSGTRAAPFDETEESDNNPGSNWPIGTGRLALQFKGAASDSLVGLYGPALLIVES